MTYRVILTPTAEAEAREASRWYARQSANVATKWLTGLDRALGGLADDPGRWPRSEDDAEALGRDIRIRLYGRRRGVFRILFVIDGDTVRVLRIRHAARGPIQ